MNEKGFRSLLRKRFIIVVLLLVQIAAIVYTLISRSTTSKITAAALAILSVSVCLYIISRRDKGAFKISWVFTYMCFCMYYNIW